MRGYSLEHWVFAKFPCNSSGVRVAIVLTEKAAQEIGGEMSKWADEVWYKTKMREPGRRSYRLRRRR